MGTTTLTAQQLQQLQMAKGGGVLHAALNALSRGGSTGMTRITRPAMVNASGTSATGQTAVLRPQQLAQGQQRIGTTYNSYKLKFLDAGIQDISTRIR